MIQYATVDFYREEFGGIGFTDDDTTLAHALRMASQKVDQMTFRRIQAFADLTPYQQKQVRLATCLQADYTDQVGTADETSGLSGYSVLDVSESYNSADAGGNTQTGFSAEAMLCLDMTGLTCRRI